MIHLSGLYKKYYGSFFFFFFWSVFQYLLLNKIWKWLILTQQKRKKKPNNKNHSKVQLDCPRMSLNYSRAMVRVKISLGGQIIQN